MYTQSNGVSIVGISAAVPKNCVKVEELMSSSTKDVAFKIMRTAKLAGLSKRHVAPPDMTVLDLATFAAERAIEIAKWENNSIDAIVFVTQTPTSLLPSTGYSLLAELNLSKNCVATDLSVSCAGLVQGIWCGANMIGKNKCHRVLVIAGDTLSKTFRPDDIGNQVLFGDGVAAVALEYNDNELLDERDFALHKGINFHLESFPDTEEFLSLNGSGYKNTTLEKGFSMHGLMVRNFTQERVPQNINAMLEKENISLADIDIFAFHQPNISLLEGIAQILNIPMEKIPTMLDSFANCSSASIGIALCHAFASVQNQDFKTLWCGFGGGFSVASMITDLNTNVISEIIFV